VSCGNLLIFYYICGIEPQIWISKDNDFDG